MPPSRRTCFLAPSPASSCLSWKHLVFTPPLRQSTPNIRHRRHRSRSSTPPALRTNASFLSRPAPARTPRPWFLSAPIIPATPACFLSRCKPIPSSQQCSRMPPASSRQEYSQFVGPLLPIPPWSSPAAYLSLRFRLLHQSECTHPNG